MKAIKIIVCLSIVVAAIVYAGATKTEFPGGLLITKAVPPAEVVVTNDWTIFTGMGEKDQVQIIDPSALSLNIAMDGGKLIKQKGKIFGTIDNLIIGPVEAATDHALLGGNEKFQVKLKGFQIGTVLAKSVKQYLVAGIYGTVAGDNPKGIKILAIDKVAGDIQGATTRVNVGLADVPTTLKLVKAKGKIGNVDATTATVVAGKEGKIKWLAKAPADNAGDVLVAAGLFAIDKSAKKNVVLVEPTAPVTNVVSSL